MTNAAEFLIRLRGLGADIRLKDGRMCVRAPRGVLNDDLRRELKASENELRQWLERVRDGQAVRPPLVQQPRPARLPLSYAQRRVWFIDRLEGPASTYNVPLAVRLEGELNAAALERALADVVARHESLRTTFPADDGIPFQHVLPAAEAVPRLVTESIPEAALADRLAAAAATVFELGREIPLRAWLFQIEPQRHVLLLLLHHIACDGWSLGPLWRDLVRAYVARCRGEAMAFPELPVQYADYTLWQRGLLGNDNDADSPLTRQLGFWRTALAGTPETLDLPTDRPRPPVASYRGANVAVPIDADLHRRLLELARAGGASLFMVLQAGLAGLLSRLGAGQDISIGSPVAGRGEPALEDLVGFFVNTLVLRTDVSGNPSFRELVGRVRDFALEAYDHQDVPFERLVEALQPARSLARQPLFQVMLVLQNTPAGELPLSDLRLPELTLRPQPLMPSVAKFDLTLGLGEQRGHDGEPLGIDAGLEYSRDLFEHATAEALGARFVRLLRAAVASPDLMLHKLEILSAPERQILLDRFNATARPVPEMTAPELFEAQAARTPEAVALIVEGHELSYRELNKRANRLAHYLISRGVGPESLVGVCLERSIHMVVALLGILKAGGAYVPLDPEYPEARLAQMMADASPAIVLNASTLRDRLPRTTVPVMLDEPQTQRLLEQAPTHNPTDLERSCPLQPLHPAYVIYTSGSTGAPKGSPNTHQGLVNRILWMQSAYPLDATDRVLQKTPYSFDVSVWEFFWPLLFGAGLVVALPKKHKDAQYLVEVIVRHRVTTLHFVPPMLHVFLEQPESISCRSLRRVICSGESLSGSVQAQFFSRLHGIELHNLYGPTEASIDVTAWSCTSKEPELTPPIGFPIWNTRMYVLDAYLEPVPVGVPGELYVAGAGLARGYLNRPSLTGQRFVADPYALVPGSRMYRTGDLARWRSDGALEFLGRADHQVKIRGFRIEPGEIEAVLVAHPAVHEAVITAPDDQHGQKRLIAHVVGDPGQPPTTSELRDYLKTKLPEYMVPAAFVLLEALPLTANGKVDRKALPVPDTVGSQSSENFVAPRTQTEWELARIWSQLLGVDRIGIHDNFFDLGGHSLLANQLISRMNDTFPVKLPLRRIFETPTLAGLAQDIQRDASGRVRESIRLLKPGSPMSVLTLVHDGVGDTLVYQSLARCMPEMVKVIGIEPHGTGYCPILHTRISDMAKYYVQQLRQIQPDGPYFIGGLCTGGKIAFDMALQLESQGLEVGFVALLDAPGPRMRVKASLMKKRQFARFAYAVRAAEGGSRFRRFLDRSAKATRKLRGFAAYEMTSRANGFIEMLRFRMLRHALDRGRPLPQFSLGLSVKTVLDFAGNEYMPSHAFEGKALLFRPNEGEGDDESLVNRNADPLFDWGGRVNGELEVVDLRGGHSSMLQGPFVDELAKLIVKNIDLYRQGELAAQARKKVERSGRHSEQQRIGNDAVLAGGSVR